MAVEYGVLAQATVTNSIGVVYTAEEKTQIQKLYFKNESGASITWEVFLNGISIRHGTFLALESYEIKDFKMAAGDEISMVCSFVDGVDVTVIGGVENYGH